MFPRDSIHLTTLSRLRRSVILPINESCDVVLYLLSLDQPNRMRYFSSAESVVVTPVVNQLERTEGMDSVVGMLQELEELVEKYLILLG